MGRIIYYVTDATLSGMCSMSADMANVTGQSRGSLSERTVAVARQVLAGERGGWRGYSAFAGPAVIASIAYVDPGNFATNIQAGAQIRLRAALGRPCSPI